MVHCQLTIFIQEIDMAVIYQITNMINGKYYIGSAGSFERRQWQHKNDLKRNAHKNPRLQSAWNKYGEEAFVFEVLETVPEGENQLKAEDVWLAQHVGQPNCYNINPGAEAPRLGIVLSDAAKSNISSGRKGKHAGENHYRYGQTVSPEVREKIGAAQRGVAKAPRTFTPEGLERARENMKRNAKPQVPADFEAVHAKFPADVQAKYDFANAVYTGALVRIEGVYCERHGIFSQYAAQFRKGRGCPECGAEQRSATNKVQMLKKWADEDGRAKMMAARKKPVDPSAPT
jgi:group I intron endonuclease